MKCTDIIQLFRTPQSSLSLSLTWCTCKPTVYNTTCSQSNMEYYNNNVFRKSLCDTSKMLRKPLIQWCLIPPNLCPISEYESSYGLLLSGHASHWWWCFSCQRCREELGWRLRQCNVSPPASAHAPWLARIGSEMEIKPQRDEADDEAPLSLHVFILLNFSSSLF